MSSARRSAWLLGSLLLGCAGGHPAPAFPASNADEEPAPPNNVPITLLPEKPEHHDVLYDSSGARRCALPCTAHVKPGEELVVEVHKGSSRSRVDIPPSLTQQWPPVTGIVEPQRGSPTTARVLLLAGGVVIVGSVALMAADCGHSGDMPGFGCMAGFALLPHAAILLVAGTIVGVASRSPGVHVLEPTGESTGLTLRPDGFALRF